MDLAEAQQALTYVEHYLSLPLKTALEAMQYASTLQAEVAQLEKDKEAYTAHKESLRAEIDALNSQAAEARTTAANETASAEAAIASTRESVTITVQQAEADVAQARENAQKDIDGFQATAAAIKHDLDTQIAVLESRKSELTRAIDLMKQSVASV